ncbi:DUF4325 domain-containing protein [Ideonella sp. DXS22W]|uniref:DUF4325 domain-containing protein n=1 Tax=Pseudaquabacterium inlustre TaxID=2984192 RepID=A0ABU9CNY4_9BURK
MARQQAPRSVLSKACDCVTELAIRHPGDLAQRLAARLSLPLAEARVLCDQLADLQWLVNAGTADRPQWRPGALRQVVRRYGLAGLQEDVPWQQDFAPYFELPAHVARIAQHAFTELVNNAIDHSGGRQVTISMRQTPLQMQLLVSDDGRGVFNSIGRQFKINDPVHAMLELAKGKLSSQPERHTGRGLFFTAKMADIFDLHANGAAFQQRGWENEDWQRGRPVCGRGTSVYVAVALDTERTVDEVLRRYSADGAGYGFERTVVPMKLLTAPQVGLESRAQARRITQRLTDFRRVELDFDGLQDIGHGFADELLRVFSREHPQVQLVPVNMAPRVAALVHSVAEPAAA